MRRCEVKVIKKMRDEVVRFAEAMELVLAANDHKSGWGDLKPTEILVRLKMELKELEESLIDQDPEEAMHEAVDIANFAMFLWTNLHFGETRHGADA